MNLTDNAKILADKIKACKTTDELRKLDKTITRHYNNGTITAKDLEKLDNLWCEQFTESEGK